MRVPWRGLSQDGHGPHILLKINHHLPTFCKGIVPARILRAYQNPYANVPPPNLFTRMAQDPARCRDRGAQFSRLAPIPTCKLPPARDLFPHLRRGGTRGSPGGVRRRSKRLGTADLDESAPDSDADELASPGPGVAAVLLRT